MHKIRRATLALIMALGAIVVIAPPSTAAPMCFGKRATIVGTRGADRLVGTGGKDVIVGLGGDDEILGRGGRDRICGGNGSDNIRGQRGPDLATGGPGEDTVKGNRGRDRVHTGPNHPWLRGGYPHDDAFGGSGNDRVIGIDALYGGAGDDRVIVIGPWKGHTTLQGGPGDDLLDESRDPDRTSVTYEAAASGITVDLSAGTVTGEGSDTLIAVTSIHGTKFADHMTGTAGDDGLVGGGGDDYLSGGPGDDGIVDGAGDDIVEMGPGNDFAMNSWGVDQHSGGDGKDHLSYSYYPYNDETGVHVDLRIGEAVTPAGVERLDGIENVKGTSRADVLIGDDGPNRLDGHYNGPDRIEGNGGDDVLEGSGDADHIDGGDGDDVVNGGGDPDQIEGGDGSDALGGGHPWEASYSGGTGNDTIRCSYTQDCNGGPGFDFIDYRSHDEVEVDLATGEGDAEYRAQGTVIAFEGVYGSREQENILRGDAGPNVLIGGPKGDRIFGVGGDDDLRGEDGDDLLDGGDGVDSGDGGPGIDHCLAVENRTRCE